jgi:hypothetical protein
MPTTNKTPQVGDLKVWWIPQIGMKTMFEVPVSSVEEGAKIMTTLAEYDLFQFKNRVKPEYSNVGGLMRYDADNGDGVPGWCDWYDEETGEDDPEQYSEDRQPVTAD